MVVDPFKKYGLKRCINAATCLIRLGGSISDPRILKAMNEASSAFINIPELQQWAGREIAKATSAEARLPTAGAVNSLMRARHLRSNQRPSRTVGGKTLLRSVIVHT